MGQKSSRPVQEKADSEERNAAPSSQVVPPAASVTVTSETRSPPVNAQGVVKESVPEPTVVPVTSPAPSERISQNGTNPAAQIENEKSGQVNAGTPSTKAKEKQLVSQKQQTQPKPQQPAQKQQPSQKQQSTQKQQPLQKQPAAQKQPATQKQPITQKPLSTQKPAKPQATQQQPIQQKQALGSKQPTQQGKAAKVKQKKQAKQSQAQSQASQPQTGKGKAVVDTSKATTTTLKSASQPVGGSLRARMSSPPKLISAQVTAATASIPSVSSLSNLATSSTSESSKMSSSSTGVRTVEKRRLEEDDHTSASAGKPNNASVKPSPKARASKLARREGDVDTSGASSVQSKPSFPSPPPAMLQRLTIDADEKEEGEISDEEMQDPSPSATATGKTSLLDRLREAPASAYLTNPVPPATSGIGNLAPRMNPTLMARIDPRTSDGSSNPPPRRAPPVFTSQSSYQQRSATTFGSAGRMGSTNIVAAPSFTEAAKNEGDQPRTKAVIGRSGNMTTVNGVAISTSQGQGESKLDEAGQRELIEIVVELHNKGIPSDELIQRGVPAQLVNRVMKALTRPASVGDAQSAGVQSTRRTSGSRPAFLPPRPSTFTASSATGTAIPRSSEPDYEGDMDMDIDDSEHEKSPQMTADAPASYTSAPAMMQFHPGFLPSMHMMPLRFHPTMPFMESTASLPAQQPQQPPPPPLPPAFSPQPPPPPLPPADAKLSLKEMKAKLLASRKVKQQSSMEADSNVLQPSDTNTPTVNEIAESATSTPRLNESLLSVKTAAQEDMPTDSDERAPSPTPSPIPASLAQSAITSRAPSPMPGVETAPISANPTLLNSRRPGAADFVDAPPSQLASSTFFRSNVRKTFAPPQPKRLVVDLDDTSDDSGSDRDDDDDGNRRQSDSELYMDETNSLRLMHEAELRIALERKKAELLEKRAKLAAYAARKKAAAQFAVETAAGIGSLSPNPIPTGLSPTPPVVSESALTTPLVQSPTHTPLLMPTAAAVPVASSTAHEARLSNGASDRSQDEGKQKEGGASKSSLKAEHRPLPITASLPHSRTARESLPVTDLTDADESPQVTAAVPAASSTSAHFKPYHFFTPHVPLTSIQPNPEINTDILDLEALKKITLSRMMAEHRQRTGKAEDDPVVCKYELRGGACNVPDCPDFHMERDVVPSQQDLMRYIDLVLPAKKTSPPHTATIRQRLQQLVRSRPDVPLKAIGAESPESAKAGMDGTAAALKAKLKRQRQAKALQDCYQERKKDVEQFLDEMRKTLQDRAVSASAR